MHKHNEYEYGTDVENRNSWPPLGKVLSNSTLQNFPQVFVSRSGESEGRPSFSQNLTIRSTLIPCWWRHSHPGRDDSFQNRKVLSLHMNRFSPCTVRYSTSTVSIQVINVKSRIVDNLLWLCYLQLKQTRIVTLSNKISIWSESHFRHRRQTHLLHQSMLDQYYYRSYTVHLCSNISAELPINWKKQTALITLQIYNK